MNNEINELMKKELWFSHFTEILYADGLISEDKKIELEKRISFINKSGATN